jgi:hypothetical protein
MIEGQIKLRQHLGDLGIDAEISKRQRMFGIW